MKYEETLKAAATRVAAATKGERNSTLNNEAFRLRRYVDQGKLPRATVEKSLINAAQRCGLKKEEIMSTLRSALGAQASKTNSNITENAGRNQSNAGGKSCASKSDDGTPISIPQLISRVDSWPFTIWPKRTSPRDGRTWDADLDMLAQVVREPIRVKTDSELEKDGLPLWAPATYEGGHRKKDKLIELSTVVLDVDEGDVTLEDIDRVFGEVTYLAHSSFSHSAEKPKWRILVPLCRRVTRDEYAAIWRWTAALITGVDPKTKDEGRGYYMPCQRPGHVYEHEVNIKGLFLDVESALARATVTEQDVEKSSNLSIVQLADLADGEWLLQKPAARQALLRLSSDETDGNEFVLLGKVGMLAGAGGSAKTTALCSLAMSVATGRLWLEKFHVTDPGNVLLILGEEDCDEIVRRLQTVARSLQLSEEDAVLAYTRIHVLPAYASDVRLVDEMGGKSEVFDNLRQYLESSDREWKLIALDPASRFMSSSAEVDAASATRFVEALESLTQVRGGPCVLVAHHVSKGSMRANDKDQGAARGSSALVDGMRWMALLDKPKFDDAIITDPRTADIPPGGIVRLTVQKSNYTRGLEHELYFRLGEGGILVPMSMAQVPVLMRGSGGKKNRAKTPPPALPDAAFIGLA